MSFQEPCLAGGIPHRAGLSWRPPGPGTFRAPFHLGSRESPGDGANESSPESREGAGKRPRRPAGGSA